MHPRGIYFLTGLDPERPETKLCRLPWFFLITEKLILLMENQYIDFTADRIGLWMEEGTELRGRWIVLRRSFKIKGKLDPQLNFIFTCFFILNLLLFKIWEESLQYIIWSLEIFDTLCSPWLSWARLLQWLARPILDSAFMETPSLASWPLAHRGAPPPFVRSCFWSRWVASHPPHLHTVRWGGQFSRWPPDHGTGSTGLHGTSSRRSLTWPVFDKLYEIIVIILVSGNNNINSFSFCIVF